MAYKPAPKPVRKRKTFRSAGNQLALPMPVQSHQVQVLRPEFDEHSGEYYGEQNNNTHLLNQIND